MKLDLILECLKKTTKKAGEKILKIYNQKYIIKNKRDGSPLTKADLVSEKIILEDLKKYNYGILSEETKRENNKFSKKVWIIDPLDGTKDFIQKTGDFSVMIALVENSVPVLGIVYKPVNDKLYYAVKNQGAFLEYKGKTKKLDVSNIDKFSEGNLVLSRNHLKKEEIGFAKKLGVNKIIRVGSVGVKIGLIAEKKAHIYFNTSDRTCEWDTAAPQIILEEAGGKMTDINGDILRYNKKNPFNLSGILATNNKNHNKIVRALRNL